MSKRLSTNFFGAASLALTLALGLISCSEDGPQQTAATTEAGTAPALPEVVATSGVLCSLTEQLAQSTVALRCLLQPGQDPHVYSPKPSDRQAIETADLVLYGGYGYEPTLIRLIQATSNAAPKVAVFEAAVPNPLMGEGHDHDEHEHGANAESDAHAHDHAEVDDHDHDHDHEAGHEADLVADPHVWHSVENGIQLVATIQAELSQIAPEHADLYRQNAATLTEQLGQIDSWIKTQVASVPPTNRKLVTTHDSFQYFAQAYGFTVGGALSGLSTQERPSAARMTALVNQVKASSVPAIFAEVSTNRQLIDTVARDADVAVPEQALFVEGPGGDGSAAQTYPEMLVVNTCTVVDALGGECDLAAAPVNLS